MQIAQASITNQYRTNCSNAKQVILPNFRHQLHESNLPFIKKHATNICELRGSKACDEYIKVFKDFNAKRLDLTELFNKYLKKFKKYGKESLLYEIMNKLDAPIKTDKANKEKIKDISQVEITVTADKHIEGKDYNILFKSGEYCSYISSSRRVRDELDSDENIKMFCKNIEEEIKNSICSKCDEELEIIEIDSEDAKSEKQYRQAENFVNKKYGDLFKS